MLKQHSGRNLLRHEEGSYIIEFAVVLPVLLLMVMGTIEFALIMFGEATLEGALAYAARVGSTGYVNLQTTGLCPSSNSSSPQAQAAYVFCVLGAGVAPLLSGANLQLTAIDLTTTPNPGPTTSCNPSGGTSTSVPPSCSSLQNFGASGDLVAYTVQYPWPIVTPLLRNILGTNGVFTLQAGAVVKNEPYSAGN